MTDLYARTVNTALFLPPLFPHANLDRRCQQRPLNARTMNTHKVGAGFAEPESLTMRNDLLQQLQRNTAAIGVENCIAEPLAGDKLAA